ncbi:HD-GYP domain-containing protein [Ornithinimicrobium panacihumi]|uniref:HD-GYP domain-containing protein n=1 Tax=Ornithinimicrobium panacihumi TaxID=2008449 RepID=UPI003F8965D0
MGLGILGVILRERDLGPHLGVSIATVVLAAALPLSGPMGAVLVGFISYASDTGAKTLRTRAFNASMTAAVGAVGAIVYLGAGGQPMMAPFPPEDQLLLQVGLPLLVAYVAMTAANVLFYAGMSAIVRGTRVVHVAWQTARQLGLGYLGHVVIAFLFAVLWGPAGLGPLSAVFVLGPLVAAHWTIGRGAAARREHGETVATFVAALEQADPQSVGHSARVADLADRMAPLVGIEGDAAESLRYAALLHDIGLVAVRPELPPDTADHLAYLSAISAHPQAGVSVLQGLDFLQDALPTIAHHHERWDGRGYPAGLAGEHIPLAARVIAVADAYDALTTDRAGEPLDQASAIATLRARAGSHLDPKVVEALATSLARVPSGPRRARRAAEPSMAGSHGPGPLVLDHDDPLISDDFAEWQPEPAGSEGR